MIISLKFEFSKGWKLLDSCGFFGFSGFCRILQNFWDTYQSRDFRY
jgi:hypothetical protein